MKYLFAAIALCAQDFGEKPCWEFYDLCFEQLAKNDPDLTYKEIRNECLSMINPKQNNFGGKNDYEYYYLDAQITAK